MAIGQRREYTKPSGRLYLMDTSDRMSNGYVGILMSATRGFVGRKRIAKRGPRAFRAPERHTTPLGTGDFRRAAAAIQSGKEKTIDRPVR